MVCVSKLFWSEEPLLFDQILGAVVGFMVPKRRFLCRALDDGPGVIVLVNSNSIFLRAGALSSSFLSSMAASNEGSDGMT